MEKTGRIVESTGSWYQVALDEDGKRSILRCRLPGRFRLDEQAVTNPVAVGDFVTVTENKDGTGTINEIAERRNYLTRQATHGRRGEQILVANIDRAIIVQSIIKPKLKEGLIDRFLVTCEAYGLEPFIVINKMDLAGRGGQNHAEDLVQLYTSLDYGILLTSTEIEATLEQLKAVLKGKTSAFIGPSGVGKSSLLNHIDPNIDRSVAEVSDYSNKGKHTTTVAKLLPLAFGGYLADTPGIREFGLVDIEDWELSLFFPEMTEPRRHCRFNTCTHSHEPGCGVIEAYHEGHITASRYNSYLNMLESLARKPREY